MPDDESNDLPGPREASPNPPDGNAKLSDFVNVSDAAKLKSVSVHAVYKARERGKLTAYEVMGQMAFKRSDIEAWTPQRGGYRGRKPNVTTDRQEDSKE